MSTVPCDFLVLSLPRLHRQTLVIHLMHIPCRLHIAENIVLKFRNRLERIWDVLILLDITNHFRGFGSLCEVDVIGSFDDRWDAIFDESKICKINP